MYLLAGTALVNQVSSTAYHFPGKRDGITTGSMRSVREILQQPQLPLIVRNTFRTDLSPSLDAELH